MSVYRTIRVLCGSVLCLTLLTANTGCVYWRLHQLRNQLSAFPDHFRIEEGEVPAIVALRPVLQPDDLGWLTGLAPSEIRLDGGRTTEVYHYVKHYADPRDDEQGLYDLPIPLHFDDDGKLREVQAPSRFASVLTEKNFNEVFGPMKDGSIERLQHATGWTWDDRRLNIPKREDVRFFFGRPYATEALDEGWADTYAFQLQGNDVRWNPTGWDIHMRFLFEPEEERVALVETYFGRLHILVDLRTETNVVHLKRL